jgi:hypothetical protein
VEEWEMKAIKPFWSISCTSPSLIGLKNKLPSAGFNMLSEKVFVRCKFERVKNQLLEGEPVPINLKLPIKIY